MSVVPPSSPATDVTTRLPHLNQNGVFNPPLQMRIFLKAAVAARGWGKVLFIATFLLGLLKSLFFQSSPVAVGVVWSLPFPKPYSPSCQPRGGHCPPRVSLGSFRSPPTNRNLAGKRSLVRKCQIWFLNNVIPCNEVAVLAREIIRTGRRPEYHTCGGPGALPTPPSGPDHCP